MQPKRRDWIGLGSRVMIEILSLSRHFEPDPDALSDYNEVGRPLVIAGSTATVRWSTRRGPVQGRMVM